MVYGEGNMGEEIIAGVGERAKDGGGEEEGIRIVVVITRSTR